MTFRPWVAGLALLAAAACGEPTGVRANFETRSDTLSAYAMSLTPIEYPSALKTVSIGLAAPQVVRASGDVPFDVAFDLASDGRVVLLPVRLVVPGASSTIATRVGLQTSDSAFATLSRAPRSGYQYDSLAVTVDTGKTVVIEVTENRYCQGFIGQTIYSKLVVDSVQAATRRIFFRTVTDPNCGFRSFLPGVPKS